MRAVLHPAQLLLISLAVWINRHQQEVLEYLVEENRVLKEQLRGRRLRLNDDQRRRLAAKGKKIGRQALVVGSGSYLRHGRTTWRVRIRKRGHAQMSSTFRRRVLAERWQARTLNELEENRYFGPNELKERVKELEASNWRLHEANTALRGELESLAGGRGQGTTGEPRG